MKQNLFDRYDLTSPISDKLLTEMGFQKIKSQWVYIANGKHIAPEIHQEGNIYYIDTTTEYGFPSLKDGNFDNHRKIIYTLSDLKECYQKCAVLNEFINETEPNETNITFPKEVSNTVGSITTAQDIENHTQWTKGHTKGSTGFAAEDANALHDRMKGKKVEEIGRNNEKNGADRISNGVYIQTKYYATASKTINAAFDSNGYRYYQDGKPMKLEVPKEQYEQAIKLMKEKISNGEVSGITNPEEAKNIVQQGYVTYKQAKNIAKAGNIDSLVFDAKGSVVSTSSTFGISFIINFAILKYKNIDTEDAIKISFIEGLKTGGVTFFGSVFTRQILRTSFGRTLAALSTKFSKSVMIEFYQTPLGKDIIHKAASFIAQKQIYGGAARNVAIKFFRTNILTNVAFILVNTVPDFWAFMNNRKSWKELTISIASSISGFGAFLIGSKLGAKIPGPAPLKIIVSMLGGILAALTASDIINRIFKTEKEKKEYDLIQTVIKELCNDYMLINEDEFDLCMNEIQRRDIINSNFIEHIRARDSEEKKKSYIYKKLKLCFENIISKRKTIVIPSTAEYIKEIEKINISEEDILNEKREDENREKEDNDDINSNV